MDAMDAKVISNNTCDYVVFLSKYRHKIDETKF